MAESTAMSDQCCTVLQEGKDHVTLQVSHRGVQSWQSSSCDDAMRVYRQKSGKHYRGSQEGGS